MRTVSHMPHMCMASVHNVFPGGHPDAKCLSRWGRICHKAEPSGLRNVPWQDAQATLPQKCSAQKMPLHPSPQGTTQGPAKPLLLWLESLPLSKVLSPVTVQQPRRISPGLPPAARPARSGRRGAVRVQARTPVPEDASDAARLPPGGRGPLPSPRSPTQARPPAHARP